MPQRQNRLPGVTWSEYGGRTRTRRPPPIAGPAPRMHDPNPGPHSNVATRGFGTSGLSRFYSPTNTNGNQFNRPAVHQALQGAIRAHTRATYFRRAGFGAALRYTLGMEQVPSHLQDYLNARLNPRNQGGQHVGPIYGHYRREQEGYHPSHESYYS